MKFYEDDDMFRDSVIKGLHVFIKMILDTRSWMLDPGCWILDTEKRNS